MRRGNCGKDIKEESADQPKNEENVFTKTIQPPKEGSFEEEGEEEKVEEMISDINKDKEDGLIDFPILEIKRVCSMNYGGIDNCLDGAQKDQNENYKTPP